MNSQEFQKATVVPLHCWDPLDECNNAIRIGNGVTIENLSTIIKPENFDLWREHIAEKDREDIARVRVALIHRFHSDITLGEPEKLSQDLLYRVFLCMRIVKPTRSRFTAIQLRWTESQKIDVTGFTYPHLSAANMPDAEVLNVLNIDDANMVRRVLEGFLKVVDGGPHFLRRAIHCYEQGYAETRAFEIQCLLWTMGIESILRGGEETPIDPTAELFKRLSKDLNIYSQATDAFHLAWPDIRLGDVAADIFQLRDRLVHGQWILEEWKRRVRDSVGGQALNYADVLRDASSFTLRSLLQQSLQFA